ncbi:thiamine diphosphokinase [bacterium]|nr:thiamine diphosphokinase [bacterium]
MSSHHIVKDFQEPALLIADGEMCSLALLESLLEWSPMVLALDNAFMKVASLGVKVDYWLGDFDDVNPNEELEKWQQSHVQVVHTPDQNATDFEKGVDFLMQKGVREVNVLWATGKRFDHSLGNMSFLTKYHGKIKLVFYNDYSRMYMLNHSFSKWYKKGQIISLMPLPFAKAVSTTGLKYLLDKEDLEWGIRIGTSNEVPHDGEVSVNYTDGHLLMIEAVE